MRFTLKYYSISKAHLQILLKSGDGDPKPHEKDHPSDNSLKKKAECDR